MSSESRACIYPNIILLRVTVASDLSKSATDNHFDDTIEETEVEHYFDYFEHGIRKTLPLKESHTERSDPTVELTKKHPCPPLGNEACSPKVHPAIRIGHDMDENGNAIRAYRIHDFEISGGDSFDGRKAKGITYRALVVDNAKVEACSHERSPNALNLSDEMGADLPEDNSNFDLSKMTEVHREKSSVSRKLGDKP